MKFLPSTLLVWTSIISGVVFLVSLMLFFQVSINRFVHPFDDVSKEIHSLKSQLETNSEKLNILKEELESKQDSILNLLALISNAEQKETRYIKLYQSSVEIMSEGINDLLRIRNTMQNQKDKETMDKLIKILVNRFEHIPGISIILPAAGEQFDPRYHMPVRIHDTNDASLDGRIKQVISAGIKIMGKIERKAEVEIYRRPKDER